MKSVLVFLAFLFCSFELSSQSLTGTNGLFKIPSAYVSSDGLSYIGASFYPKGYYELYNNGDRFTGMPTFVTLSLYDRVEFMFRYTHQLGQEVSPQTYYFPDRMFSFRYNALKERYKYPSVTFGFHDVSEALGGTSATPWFLATYVVASKNIFTKSLIISPTVGYSYDIIKRNRNQIFDGFFGGFELTAIQYPFLTFVGEYDSESFNIAIKTTLFDHLHFAVGLLNVKALSGFVTYRFNLLNR